MGGRLWGCTESDIPEESQGRGSLECNPEIPAFPGLEMRPSSIAPNPVESREGPRHLHRIPRLSEEPWEAAV